MGTDSWIDEAISGALAHMDTPVYSFKGCELKKQYCRCLAVEIDEDRRLLRCQECGKYLAPFDWVVKIAKRETSLGHRYNSLRGDVLQIAEVVKRLKQEERNIRARLRRLSAKEAPR